MSRVLVIGARRRRQGIGEFVARWFAARGAEICAVVGSRAESAEIARQKLASSYGIECRAYDAVETALKREEPDIVAICSPYVHHKDHLRAAAAAGAHCLCEKPLWWQKEPSDPGEETVRIVDAFLDRGRSV